MNGFASGDFGKKLGLIDERFDLSDITGSCTVSRIVS